MKPKLLVSACLLGQPVRYDGKSFPNEAVIGLADVAELVPVCPECLGGLPVPRTPCEIAPGSGELRVMSVDGENRTEAFLRGARECLRMARANGCTLAVLKSNSPSCGSGMIYDGSFSGTLVPGDGVTTRVLTSEGVRVISENDVEAGRLASLG